MLSPFPKCVEVMVLRSIPPVEPPAGTSRPPALFELVMELCPTLFSASVPVTNTLWAVVLVSPSRDLGCAQVHAGHVLHLEICIPASFRKSLFAGSDARKKFS